ncbi:uncharacterized protein LOC122011246 [Zingiber officinale]|uniref:uncharacterized protein LOC122011246 n=1 Tax=Zingiber officinale TaxID=94328 RepID=UPI001C4D5ADC|nr:uncharacterized protein LOC122011246 [Zingiber officinale]XP_042423583.1 uncharacterized protein LOC122011246 [Zingiber officinale]
MKPMQQNALAVAVAAADRDHPSICMKPRWLSPLPTIAVPVQPLLRLPSNHLDLLDRCDPEAGAGFPGILIPKGGGTEDSVLSSPSLFCGYPPNRVANPVVFDSRFGRDRPPGPVGHFPAIHSSLNSPILCL